MNFSQQVQTIVIKNMLVSYRNREFLFECLIPSIVALILALQEQLIPLNQLMPLIYALATSSTQRSIMIQLVEEKSKRYKETQKIMGLDDRAYLTGWVITGYIRITISMLAFIISGFLFGLIVNFQWDAHYNDSPWELIWPLLIFGFTVYILPKQAMNQQFFFSSIFNETKIAGEVQTFICVALTFFIYFTFVDWAAGSLVFYVILTTLSPQCGLAFSYVGSMIPVPKGDLLSMNLFPVDIIVDTYNPTQAGTQLACLFVVYFILFLYTDQVIPNEYGIAKHPLFFLDLLTKKSKIQIDEITIQQTNDTSSALYHEEISMQSPPSIVINNFTKQFGKLKAVDNISLSLYESQIFCLLGHNGAGKTTMISMLTGMISKSSGNVQMYGLSLDTQLQQIRQSLGLCTQKDCLYMELTVLEHLRFIAGIKGQINPKDLTDVMTKTDLEHEKNKRVSELSGGSRRKLSLAMALVGNSKIIFLDEPTSGMDAYSRRAIWDILEKVKQDQRTIILTTHHLDEAEILANRIGIMSKGQLLAVGSSEFIKRKFGEGYSLKLKLNEQSLTQRTQIIQTIIQQIPQSSYDQQHSTQEQIVVLVPFSQQRFLEKVFEKLENMGNIKIELQMNTLEDAFIKIGLEDDDHSKETGYNQSVQRVENQHDSSYESQHLVNDYPKCLSQEPTFNFFSQVYAVFLRKFYSTIRTNTNYIAIMIPMLTFLLGIVTVGSIDFESLVDDGKMDPIQLAGTVEFLKISMASSLSVLAFCFNASVYIALPVQEKELYLKQVLTGMGCRTSSYWIGTFLFDYVLYMILVAQFYLLSFIMNLDITFDYWHKGLISFACFGWSYLLNAYIMGFVFNKLEKALKLFAIFCFFVGFALPFMVLGLIDFLYTQFDKPYSLEFTIYVFQMFFAVISPFYAFFEAYTFLSGKFQILDAFYGTPQLLHETYYFCYILLGQSLIQCALLYYLENNQKSFSKTVIRDSNDFEKLEQDVKKERARVLDGTDDIIQALSLQKSYIENQEVLQSVTFGIKQGEIFGIIGPNGAGKSTVMNIFTGITDATGGRALLKQVNPQDKDMTIMQHVGICPQFDCIWENLTPLEHLRLFARIKGLKGQDLETAVQYFIKTMQLDLFKNTKAGQLSGGNKRKLCVADALIGGSDITFFDEPSTGVDPISRRFLFNTLKRNVQLRNCSAIMTTHTIEEAESLSQRIGILIAGQFMCLGTPEYLRSKYGTGYQICLKFDNEQATSDHICKEVLGEFPQSKQLEDKRSNFLTFSIRDEEFSFHRTFKFFETLIQKRVIQDFQINESSLEQIFIHFTRMQQEINEKAGLAID